MIGGSTLGRREEDLSCEMSTAGREEVGWATPGRIRHTSQVDRRGAALGRPLKQQMNGQESRVAGPSNEFGFLVHEDLRGCSSVGVRI